MQNLSADEIIINLKKVGEKYSEILSYLLQGRGKFFPPNLVDMDKMQLILTSIYKQYFIKPENFIQINHVFCENLKKLIDNSVSRFVKAENLDPLYKTDKKDKRFKDAAWQDNIFFDFVKQYYLMSAELMQQYAKNFELEPELKKYSEFVTKQFIDALSPTNFIFSNPEILRESLASGWQNIVLGLEKFLEDLKNSEVLCIPTNDQSAFVLGKNLACSKGKVVFQNKLLQLIYYEPKEQAHQIPVLIVPAWINKYYVLDLSADNSLVSYLINNNLQVFMISWVNPDKSLRDIDFEDYLQALLDSVDYLISLGYEKINGVGYCLGGALLAICISYLKSCNKQYISNVSFFTSMLDYADSGEIGVFINEHTIQVIEAEMNITGFFDGRYLANSFSLLRANDLIWSYFINNYLLSKIPIAFDLMYWNADSTNLPAKMNSYYLRNLYLHNYLKVPNKLQMLGVAIDLGKIDIPSFSVAAINDHIAPWKAVYNSIKLFGGEKTFCLSSAGHIAGIVNPPANSKYTYKLNANLAQHGEEWLKNSVEFQGSWWPYWLEWLLSKNGKLERVKYKNLPAIEPAPGSYVMKRYN